MYKNKHGMYSLVHSFLEPPPIFIPIEVSEQIAIHFEKIN